MDWIIYFLLMLVVMSLPLLALCLGYCVVSLI